MVMKFSSKEDDTIIMIKVDHKVAWEFMLKVPR